MLKIGKLTEKATGLTYDIYSVPSERDASKSYVVGVINLYAARCTCPWKQHHPSRRCKHMIAAQQWLDEQRKQQREEVNV